jgi:hypothetical protein
MRTVWLLKSTLPTNAHNAIFCITSASKSLQSFNAQLFPIKTIHVYMAEQERKRKNRKQFCLGNNLEK